LEKQKFFRNEKAFVPKKKEKTKKNFLFKTREIQKCIFSKFLFYTHFIFYHFLLFFFSKKTIKNDKKRSKKNDTKQYKIKICSCVQVFKEENFLSSFLNLLYKR
jgi:hypothetical protein